MILTQLLVRKFIIGLPFYDLVSISVEWRFYVLTFSTVLIAAAGYIINDYFDIKIDLINKPKKVYVGRIIKRRYALLTHQLLSGFAIVLGFFLGLKILIVKIVAVVLLWFYASIFKKKAFLGNLIVSFLTALAIFEIDLLYNQNSKLLYIYAVFAFFINLIREIIKDIEDIRGDKMHGAVTLPIKIGIRKTKLVIYGLFTILASLVLKLSIGIGNPKLWFVFSILGFLVSIFIYKLIFSDRKKHFQELSKLCKLIMILGILSMIVL